METLDADSAAALLKRGGVVAYPTEGVWGLGCDPRNEEAVLRILAIKQREVEKGLILIAAHEAQLASFVALDALDDAQSAAVRARWPGAATWIVPAAPDAPCWITGRHDGIAVRVSAHPPVIGLCNAFGGALVSTSANRAGQPAPTRAADLDPEVVALLDGVLAGETGGLLQPTPIRDARSGAVVRG